MEYELVYDFETCQCTEEDYECDYGYFRSSNGACIREDGEVISYEPPAKCDGYYKVS